MRAIFGSFVMILGASVFASSAWGQGRAEQDARWQQAVDLSTAEDYPGAAAVYRQLFSDYPKCQLAALRVAINEQKAGNSAGAAISFSAANAVDPHGYWAEVGLYHEAEFHISQGDTAQAQACLQQLEERFPESRWCARARAAVGMAVLSLPNNQSENTATTGQDNAAEIAVIEATLARENEAWEAFRQANISRGQGQDNQRLAALHQVIRRFPNAGASLEARKSRGYLLIRNQRLSEAAAEFAALADDLRYSSPNSRIRYDAEYRLAAIDHALGNKQEALARYAGLAESASDSQIVSQAATQAAGLQLERTQAKLTGQKTVVAEDWNKVRAYAARVHSCGAKRMADRARADLLTMESYYWEGRSEDAVAAGESFLQVYDAEEHKQDTATVSFFAGEEYLKLGDYESALRHFHKVIALYEGESEIWKGMDHLPRSYYRVWEVMRMSKADEAEITVAAQALLSRFPNSEYAKPVSEWLRSKEEISYGL